MTYRRPVAVKINGSTAGACARCRVPGDRAVTHHHWSTGALNSVVRKDRTTMRVGTRRGVPGDRAVAHRHRAMIRVNGAALSGIARRGISEEHTLINRQCSFGECFDRTALIPASCSPTGQRQLLQRRVASSKLD